MTDIPLAGDSTRLNPTSHSTNSQNWPQHIVAVSLEGIDGAGKSTLVNELGRDPVLQRVFGAVRVFREFDSPIGESLRRNLHLLSPISIAYAFSAERHWLVEQLAPDASGLVVLDRYIDSAKACRAADIEAGLAPPYVMDVVCELTARLPSPHLTIYLDTPVNWASRRLAQRQLRQGLPLRVGDSLLELQRRAYDRLFEESGRVYTRLHGEFSLYELQKRARQTIMDLVATKGRGIAGEVGRPAQPA